VIINQVPADIIISGILSSPNESRAVEFKPSIPWPSRDLQLDSKAPEIIKSVLGMSNLRDGGRIILGVERETTKKRYVLNGMKKSHLQTYDHDIIFPLIANYGDPRPNFQIANVEYQGKNFIVFSVQTFDISPIICKKKLEKPSTNPQWPGTVLIECPALYIRNDKPETKKADLPQEMREVINLAIEKELDVFSARMQRFFRTMSKVKVVKSPIDDKKKFDMERGDLP